MGIFPDLFNVPDAIPSSASADPDSALPAESAD
jgi:hypothetical protein